MSHIDSDLAELQEQYEDRDWFAEVGLDEYSRCVVYVKYMNRETLAIPTYTEEGREVCVHFLSSKMVTRDQFVEKQGGVSLPVYQPLMAPFPIDLMTELTELTEQVTENKSLVYLQRSLERLEKDCGSNILQDLFYELHDGKNAVTNNSSRYPEVWKKLGKLYEIYGFDVIYENIDG
jgi:hypothetical protein